MELKTTPDYGDGDHAVSRSSHASQDDISIEECERLVLSPPPVPMNMELACAAIHAAARRSHSSRTHSIKTQPHDGHSDTHSHPSDLDLCNSKQDVHHTTSNPHRSGSTSRWRRLLCCFSDRSATVSRDQKRAPYTRNLTDHSVMDTENGDMALVSSGPDRSAKKPRSRKLKLFSSRPTHESKSNNVTSAEKHKNEFPIPLDRFPQKPIPLPHSVSDAKTDISATPVTTIQNYHPTLPNYVLNSLIRTDRPASCPLVSPANGHGLSELDNCTTKPSSPAVHPPTNKMHSSFTITFPKLPGFRRPTYETTALPCEANQRDLPSSSSPSDISSPALYTTDGTLSHAHEESSAIPRLLPHGTSWDSGDVDASVPLDIDQDDYHTMHDQNGGQGDSSSENLDMLTPGMNLLGDVPEDCVNKKCLVLDLDETLVHSWFKYVENANFVVPVDLDGVKHQIYVCKRPHLDEFLSAVGPLFECVMFTASLRKYADPVCDYIDSDSYFRHRLFREACVYHQNNLIKDLNRLGRDKDQICIVDNSPVSFLFQPENALQIISWFDDPHDRALLDLIPYLTALAKSDTVVGYLREFQPPSSAAVVPPNPPPFLYLFNPSLTDDQDGSEAALDEVCYSYTEEDAVFSPHFHPPSTNTSTNSLRSYLAQVDRDHTTTQSANTQLATHQHRIQLTSSANNSVVVTSMSPSSPPPPPTAASFIHQVSQPETTGINSIGARISSPGELQDTKTT